jgi:hypothetical protein
MDFLFHFYNRGDCKSKSLTQNEAKQHFDLDRFKEISLRASSSLKAIDFQKKTNAPTLCKEYKVQKKTLSIPFHQKVALVGALGTIAGAVLPYGGFSNALGYFGMGLQVLSSFSLVQNCFINPSIQAAIPLASLGLTFTPLKPLVQTISTFNMCLDSYKEAKHTLNQMDGSNNLLIGRNLLVYSINALHSCYNLWGSLHPRVNPKIEEAKKLLFGDTPPQTVDIKAINKRYRELALKNHPDKGGDQDFFNKLSEAKEILLKNFRSTPLQPEAAETNPKEGTSPYEDDMMAFSSLITRVEPRTSLLEVSDRAAAHALGDSFVMGSNLEGWNTKEGIDFLNQITEGISKELKDVVTDLVSEVELIPESKAHQILFGRIFSQKVKKLTPGKSIILEGGWQTENSFGHAMLYEFAKAKDGTYNIYIYNTGAGTNYHYFEKEKPHKNLIDPDLKDKISPEKTYITPFIKFEGVRAGEIGLDGEEVDPYFFDKLIALNSFRRISPEEELYKKILGHLEHRQVKNPKESKDFFLTLPQRSGVCVWTVLLYAALRRKLGGDPLKGLALEYRIQRDTYDNYCSLLHSPFEEVRQELCIRAGEKLIRNLAKFHERLLSANEVKKEHVQIDRTTSFLRSEPNNFPNIEKISLKPIMYLENESYKTTVEHIASYDEPPTADYIELSSFSGKKLELQEISSLISELSLIQSFPKVQVVKDLDISIQIERLARALPKPIEFKNFWKEASKEELLQCQSLLLNSLRKYTDIQIAPQDHSRIISEQTTAWALLSLIHHITTRIDSRVTSYAFYSSRFQDLIQSPRSTFFSKEDLEFYQDVVEYFKMEEKKKTRNSDEIFNLATTFSRRISSNSPPLPEDELLLSIAKDHPQILAKINTEVEKMLNSGNYFGFARSILQRAVIWSNNEIFLNSPETAHIGTLREAAFQAMKFTDLITSWGNNEYGFIASKSEENPSSLYAQEGTLLNRKKYEYPLVPDEIDSFDSSLFLNQPKDFFNKDIERSYFENQIAKITIKWNQYLPTRLSLTTCEKTLQCAKIVYYFTEHIEDFTDVKKQNLFLLSLFQAWDPKKQKASAPIQEAIKNPDFIKQVCEFINKGIVTFSESQKRPMIEQSLFFIQVARRLKELDPTLPLPDLTSQINSWLLREDLTEKEVDLLHLHRILQYRVDQEELNGLTQENLAESDKLLEVLESWMYVSRKFYRPWHQLHSQHESKRFIFSLKPVLERLSSKFLTKLVSKLTPERAEEIQGSTFKSNKPDSSIYKMNNGNRKIELDPLHGKLYADGEEIHIGLQADLTRSQSYSRIFGIKKHRITVEGKKLLFRANGKRFRAFSANHNSYGNHTIELFHEGVWYQYRSIYLTPDLEKKISRSIIADHFVFARPKKFTVGSTETSSTDLLFINQKTLDVDYTFKDGIFLDKLGNTIVLKNPSKNSSFSFSLGMFEKEPWFIQTKLLGGEYRIELPRYSRSAQGLEFISSPRGLMWKENPKFILKEAPSQVLGSCPNYLFLQDVEGKKSKILMPLRPIFREKESLVPNAKLDIDKEERGYRHTQLDSPQSETNTYVEYDVQNGKVIPLSIEGALFLAYIKLGDKKYEEALSIFNEDLNLKLHFDLNEQVERLLKWIMTEGSGSAVSSVLSLKAALILQSEFERNPEKIKAELDEYQLFRLNLQGFFRTYKNGLNNVPGSLRFSGEDLKRLKSLNPRRTISSQGHLKDQHIHFMSGSIDPLKCADPSSKEHSACFLNEFKEFYNSFLQASLDAKTFLFFKNRDYLSSEKTRAFSNVLKQIIIHPDKKYKPYPEGAFSRLKVSNWLSQFSDINNDGPFLYKNPNLSIKTGKPSLKEHRVIVQSLAEALHKARLHKPLEAFTLKVPTLRYARGTSSIASQFFYPKKLSEESLTKQAISLKNSASEIYRSVVDKELSDFVIEYQEGKKKNENEVSYHLKEGFEIADVRYDIENHLNTLRTQTKALEKEIRFFLNKSPQSNDQEELQELLVSGRIAPTYKIDDAIASFLDGKSSNYLSLNPHLTQQDILEFDAKIEEFLSLSIEGNQLKRALQAKDPNSIGQILSEKTEYESKKYKDFRRIFLVYEYRAGIKVREIQVALIAKKLEKNIEGIYKNSVSQLIMGGGKTSVLASILLYLASKPGRIAIFIPPSEQFTTLKENLGNTQKKHFKQKVVPIRYSRSQLTLKRLEWIQERLKDSKKGRDVLLMTRETAESFQLEYLSLLERMTLTGIDEKRAQLLADILTEMKKYGDVLGDEVDILLNPLRETNFPVGEKQLITPELVDMVRQIFALLISPEFRDRLNLQANKQASNGEILNKEILKEVLDRFYDTYTHKLGFKPSQKQAVIDFVLAEGEYPGNKEQKAQLSLQRHLFKDVLPLTLAKSTGQHYGRVHTEDVGPYNGVDNPSFTEFGSPWEAMSYHFQTVLSRGVTQLQVKDLANSLVLSAIESAKKERVLFEDTRENKIFKELTGYSLLEVEDEAVLEKATLKANKKPQAQLTIESNTITKIVGSFVRYFRSTPQSFVDLFSSFRAFSGTPWNHPSYSEKLQGNIILDTGTEGKIIDTFLKRANPQTLHATSSSSPKRTLHSVLEKMTPDRQPLLRGFIDVAGLFKETSNHEIAKEIAEFCKESHLPIKTVLYFGRPEPKAPMTLMALKEGAKEPIVIGSTQREEIEKNGISPESTFVYYDESHSEATDILQKEDAINVISLNHKTIRRSFLQGMLRLRGYFERQDLEYVIPQDEIEHFSGHKEKIPTHEEILQKTVQNQAIRIGDETLRSYKQKIDNALRQVAIEKILDAKGISWQRSLFSQFQDVLEVKQEVDLFKLFGSPESYVPSIESLEKYRQEKEALFVKLSRDRTLNKEVKNLLDVIMNSARKSPYLPSEVKAVKGGDLGSQREIAQEISVQREVDQELNQDLRKELDEYLSMGETFEFKEVPWHESQISNSISTSSPNSWQNAFRDILGAHPQIYTLPDLLSEKTPFTYKNPYHMLFEKDLWISDNYAHTIQEITPIFSKLQKNAEQILFIKQSDGLKGILVSSLEAALFKSHLEKNPRKDMWLVLPDGHSYIQNPPMMEKADIPAFKNLLWQVNLFNGNVEALLQDKETKERIAKLDKDLLKRFLKLKIELQPSQKALYYAQFEENPDEKTSTDLEFLFHKQGD